MKKLLLFLSVLFSFAVAKSQFIYKIKADSVLITNDSCTAELNLENSTKNIKGFLYNKGNGRTEFRKAEKLNDSTIIIGADTISLAGNIYGITANNGLTKTGNTIQLGQSVGALGNPAALTSHREIPLKNYTIQLISDGLDSSFLPHGGLLFFDNNPTVPSPFLEISGRNIATGNTFSAGTRIFTMAMYGIYRPSAGSGNVGMIAIGDEFQPSGGNSIYNSILAEPQIMNSAGGGQAISYASKPQVNQTGTASTTIRGFYHNPVLGSLLGAHIAYENTTGNNLLNTTSGATSIRRTGTPTAYLHLGAGTATTNTAPLKFTSGTLLTTPEAGAMEFLTDKVYLTITSGSSRKQFVLSDTTLTLNTIPFVASGGRLQSDANFKWFNGSKTFVMTGTQDITSILTGTDNTPSINISSDWTTSGTPTALLIDVTDNSSNSASALMDLRTSGSSHFFVRKDGNTGIGITSPTAKLHLKAGTNTAGTAPLKFTAGTNLSTPEAGTVEFDGTNYYATASTTRYTLAKTLTATATLDFGSTAAGAKTDLTITVTGAASGDVVSVGVPNGSIVANGSFSAWVSASNTVTVRFTNNDLTTSYDPASGTFRVSVLKY